jgi:hypothetical protein
MSDGEPHALSKMDTDFAVDFHLNRMHLQIDTSGFLRNGETRLLWLPVTLRGYAIATRPPVIVIGGRSGTVTFIHD